MNYTSKIIQLAGEECLHYTVVIEKETICGIKLQDRQTILKYNLDETKLCNECKEKSPVPRLKDWCPRYKIENGDQAKSALCTMHLFYQSLHEQVQLAWAIHEYAFYRICQTTNILVNFHPIILDVKEEEKLLEVSLIGGDGRVKKELPFELIEEFMPLIKEDFLDSLQERTN